MERIALTADSTGVFYTNTITLVPNNGTHTILTSGRDSTATSDSSIHRIPTAVGFLEKHEVIGAIFITSVTVPSVGASE